MGTGLQGLSFLSPPLLPLLGTFFLSATERATVSGHKSKYPHSGVLGGQSRLGPRWVELFLSSPAKCQESCVTWVSKLFGITYRAADEPVPCVCLSSEAMNKLRSPELMSSLA